MAALTSSSPAASRAGVEPSLALGGVGDVAGGLEAIGELRRERVANSAIFGDTLHSGPHRVARRSADCAEPASAPSKVGNSTR